MWMSYLFFVSEDLEGLDLIGPDLTNIMMVISA